MSPSTPTSSTSAGPRLTTVPIDVRAACERCRTRKLKCSGQPIDPAVQADNIAVGGPDAMLKCARCVKENHECLFASRAPIGRPKKRKSEDGTDIPSAAALKRAALAAARAANGETESEASTSAKPRARKRTKKEAGAALDPLLPEAGPSSAGASSAAAALASTSTLPSEAEQHAMVAHAAAAAAAAAAIAMGASTHAHDYGEAHLEPPPPSSLGTFTDVPSPAAAASTLLDFRYQQQPGNPVGLAPSASSSSIDWYPQARRQPDGPPDPPPTFPDASSSASTSVAAAPGSANASQPNGSQATLSQANGSHANGHAAPPAIPNGNMNAKDPEIEPDFRMRPQQGLHPIPHQSDLAGGSDIIRDFRERPQQRIHHIPSQRDFDPGPAFIPVSHIPQLQSNTFLPNYVHPRSDSSSFVPASMSSAMGFPGSSPAQHGFNQSMAMPTSLPSSGPNAPATGYEALHVPGTSTGPSLNSLSLAAFLSSLDTLSLTASDGLTPAMLDSSSLGGSLVPVQGPAMTSQRPTQPSPATPAFGLSDVRPNEASHGMILGSALFTDLSQSQQARISTSSTTSKPPSGSLSARGNLGERQQASHAQPAWGSMSLPSVNSQTSGQAMGINHLAATTVPPGVAAPGTNQPMAITATTQELAGLSYALPADFSWWDDFFNKGPLFATAKQSSGGNGGTTSSVVGEGSASQPSTDPRRQQLPNLEAGQSMEMDKADTAKTLQVQAHEQQAPSQATKKSCCQPRTTASPANPTPGTAGSTQAAASCCSGKGKEKASVNTSASQNSELTSSAASVAYEKAPSVEAAAASGTVHCVPDPTGEGCTCLCNAEVALLSVRRVLKRTEAIPLDGAYGEEAADASGARRNAAAAVATTLHLTLSASQAVSAQCACSADCPTCREDSAWGKSGRKRQSSAPGEASKKASPRIVSASLLVSTALQIYARAVKMLRETLATAAPPALLEAARQKDTENAEAGVEGSGSTLASHPGTPKLCAAPNPEAWSCSHPGHSYTSSALQTPTMSVSALPARTRVRSASSGSVSTGVGMSLVPPQSPPASCCDTTASSELNRRRRAGSGSATNTPTALARATKPLPAPTPELDIDIKIGNTYRPLPHNARRIALFAMKLELRDLQEALRKVAVLAQADGVVGWPEGAAPPSEAEVNASESDGKATLAGTTALAPTLNPIDRMVINKLHVQLGELLNTVESLEQW